jgi:hypothetical protein
MTAGITKLDYMGMLIIDRANRAVSANAGRNWKFQYQRSCEDKAN